MSSTTLPQAKQTFRSIKRLVYRFTAYVVLVRINTMAKNKKKQRQPNLPAVANLRPRVDGLLHDGQILHQEDDEILASLDAISRRVSAAEFLPILLLSYAQATDTQQERLVPLLPNWLAQQNHQDTLYRLIQAGNLTDLQQELALHWLETTGYDVAALRAELEQSMFYEAYMYSDDMQGNLSIFFFSDRRRNRVQGFSFLLDFQPPWEGSIKDVSLYAKKNPQQAIDDFLALWEGYMSDIVMQKISDTEAKKAVITALQQNREQDIRLHSDFRPLRDLFIQQILTLPDEPDTPAFSVEDLDYLLQHGKSSESIQIEEQTMGYRMRTPDGKELRIMRPSDDLL